MRISEDFLMEAEFNESLEKEIYSILNKLNFPIPKKILLDGKWSDTASKVVTEFGDKAFDLLIDSCKIQVKVAAKETNNKKKPRAKIHMHYYYKWAGDTGDFEISGVLGLVGNKWVNV